MRFKFAVVSSLAGAIVAPAQAMNPACQPLMQSQTNMAARPVHIFMTETRTWSKPLSQAAAGMNMGGTKKSEEISTGNPLYVKHGARWIDMQTSFAEMMKLGDPNDPDTKKALEAKQCKALPDEAVSGQAAAVYQEHNPSGIDTKIWISKSTHLPLKSEITNKAGGPALTSFTVSTYDYDGVRAPVGAISMKQMMESGSADRAANRQTFEEAPMSLRFVRCVLLGTAIFFALSANETAAAKLQVIYNFAGGSGDGANPAGPLLVDDQGSLYGTTTNGGSANNGTVFKISPHGRESILHVFTGASGDGAQPFGGVITDKSGNLYGATTGGGANGLGIVFTLAPNGVETLQHTFQGICCGSDGSFPYTSLVVDTQGNMYGTTMKGGNSSDLGTVFRVTPAGAETVIHAFSGASDGSEPLLGLLKGQKSVLYGATGLGGAQNAGVAFRMTLDGRETVLHQFGSGSDGLYPQGWIAVDDKGAIYGTTANGGGSANAGIVYKIDKNGFESILHVFNGADGGTPLSVTLIGSDLYGVTAFGGADDDGTIFKIASDGVFSVLHSFSGMDGREPTCPLVTDSNGNLYGTTIGGGANSDGVVFKLTFKKKRSD